jgi:hypothetical protein
MLFPIFADLSRVPPTRCEQSISARNLQKGTNAFMTARQSHTKSVIGLLQLISCFRCACVHVLLSHLFLSSAHCTHRPCSWSRLGQCLAHLGRSNEAARAFACGRARVSADSAEQLRQHTVDLFESVFSSAVQGFGALARQQDGGSGRSGSQSPEGSKPSIISANSQR